MTALDLFLHLTTAGCQLTRQGDTLRVHDPQHVLTDALRQQIREHKAALLAMLTPERPVSFTPVSRAVLAVPGAKRTARTAVSRMRDLSGARTAGGATPCPLTSWCPCPTCGVWQ